MAVLMNAKEISEELGISKTLAYQIMEKLNKELEESICSVSIICLIVNTIK